MMGCDALLCAYPRRRDAAPETLPTRGPLTDHAAAPERMVHQFCQGPMDRAKVRVPNEADCSNRRPWLHVHAPSRTRAIMPARLHADSHSCPRSAAR